MSKYIRKFIVPFAIVVAGIQYECSAYASDEAISGRVHRSRGDQVHACFNEGITLAAQQEFQVVRHTVHSLPKGATETTSEHVGVIRIEAVGPGLCATAKLVEGFAQVLDWLEAKANP